MVEFRTKYVWINTFGIKDSKHWKKCPHYIKLQHDRKGLNSVLKSKMEWMKNIPMTSMKWRKVVLGLQKKPCPAIGEIIRHKKVKCDHLIKYLLSNQPK